MKKYLIECLGTFLLVFIGTGIASNIEVLTAMREFQIVIISITFGVTLYGIVTFFGPLSGAHVNPAVTLGAWIHGNISDHDVVPYWIAQFAGAIFGSVILCMIFGWSNHPLAETTFGTLSPLTALIIEAAFTFFFVSVILLNAGKRHGSLMIGGTLALIHFIGIPLTGASVNPARSIAPVVVGMSPLAASQVWVYVIGPLVGAAAAGLILRKKKP